VPIDNSKTERGEMGEWYDQTWDNEPGGEILPRSEHATVVMGKKIIIIGGMGAHFVRDDICIIDTGTPPPQALTILCNLPKLWM